MISAFERALGWVACVAAVVLLAAALLLGARAQAEVRVSAATVRLPAVAGRPAAGYLTITADAADAVVVGAASPMAERVELHGTSMAGGVMQMVKLPALRVRAGSSGGFAPGGNHLMIFGLRKGIAPGATIPVVLRLADGKTLRADALAVAAGAALPAHGAH